MEKERNQISKILHVIGAIIFLFAFILGIVLGAVMDGISYESDFNAVIMFGVWGGGFISGMVFIALAEIIDLQDIGNKNAEKMINRQETTNEYIKSMNANTEKMLAALMGIKSNQISKTDFEQIITAQNPNAEDKDN